MGDVADPRRDFPPDPPAPDEDDPPLPPLPELPQNQLPDEVVAAVTPQQLGLLDRGALLRVTASFLHSFGFGDVASTLEWQSGAPAASTLAQTLLSLTLAGRWDEIVAEIERIPCLAPKPYRAAAFLVRRQQFLERLGPPNRFAMAERLLREHIHPLVAGAVPITSDPVLLLVRDMNSLARAVAPEQREQQRIGLFLHLLTVLPPMIFVRGRMLEGALELLFLNPEWWPYARSFWRRLNSLFYASKCYTHPIGWTCHKKARDHKGEVLQVQFSNTGQYLAASSSDCTVIIWMLDYVYNMTLKHTLKEHEKPVTSLKWNFNDTELLTCAKGEVAKLWDVDTGICKCTFRISNNGGVSSCALHHYEETMFFSSCGPSSFIYRTDQQNNELIAMNIIPEVSDMVATHGGLLICVGSDNIIRVLSFSGDVRYYFKEERVVTSVSLSADHRLLIANVNSEEISVWDIEKQMKERRYKACKQIVGSSLEGSDNVFIASGSVGSQIYVWNREYQLPFRILTGHEKAVNSVSWNPARRNILASGSADGSVGIWVG